MAAEDGSVATVSDDRQSIIDTLHDYLERVDANDPHGAAGDFADEGWADYMTGTRLIGADAVGGALERLLPNFAVTSHHVSNVRVWPDGEEARVRAYIYAYHRLVESGEPWHFWGRYQITMRRFGHDWCIPELTLVGVDSEPEWRLAPRDQFAGHPGRTPTV